MSLLVNKTCQSFHAEGVAVAFDMVWKLNLQEVICLSKITHSSPGINDLFDEKEEIELI